MWAAARKCPVLAEKFPDCLCSLQCDCAGLLLWWGPEAHPRGAARSYSTLSAPSACWTCQTSPLEGRGATELSDGSWNLLSALCPEATPSVARLSQAATAWLPVFFLLWYLLINKIFNFNVVQCTIFFYVYCFLFLFIRNIFLSKGNKDILLYYFLKTNGFWFFMCQFVIHQELIFAYGVCQESNCIFQLF